MARTEMEKRWDGLKTAYGVRLALHPAFVYVKSLLTTVIHDGNFWTSEGEAQKQRVNVRIPDFVLCIMGACMTIEEMNALLRQGASETEAALTEIQKTYNRVSAFRDSFLPTLHSFNAEIRETRMTTEREMRQTLEWLQNVREFFAEKDYGPQMQRIRDFIAICKQVKALKDAGTLDAMADLAIKLAVQEESDGGK